MGYKVKLDDEVKFDGRRISPEPKVYVLLNKPKGFATTTAEGKGRTVMDLVANATSAKIKPIGRLGRNSLGLLLFTNDDKIVQKFTNSKIGVARLFQLDLDKNLKFEVTIPKPCPIVEADRGEMEQLFTNLVSNAIKFRGEIPVRIHISAERQADDWVFSIRDNGIGIDSTGVERIFELFHRLHTADEYPGTGLGLTISRKIVDYHGGEIWVESRLDHGSTFHVTLPTQVAGIEADDRHEQTLD